MSTVSRHSPAVIPIAASKMFERMAYYGMRAVFVLCMVNGSLQFSKEEASTVYGVFTAVVALMPLLGGLFGDFICGVRIASIIGLSMQAIGCFLLAAPGIYAFYGGLVLISAGTGFYNPNAMAALSFAYQPRKKTMDAAFQIFYMAINAGAFAAPLIVGGLAAENFTAGFIIAGFFSLVSLAILVGYNKLLTEVPVRPNIYYTEQTQAFNAGRRVLFVISGILAYFLFWLLSSFSGNIVYDLGYQLGDKMPGFQNILMMLNPVIMILLGIVLTVVWTFLYIPSHIKMAIAFVIFSMSAFLLAATLSPQIDDSTALFIIVTIVLQAVAELFISPIALSYICQHASPKFISSLIAVTLAMIYLCSSLVSFITVHFPLSSGLLGAVLGIVSVFAAAWFVVIALLSKNKTGRKQCFLKILFFPVIFSVLQRIIYRRSI